MSTREERKNPFYSEKALYTSGGLAPGERTLIMWRADNGRDQNEHGEFKETCCVFNPDVL